MADRVVWHDVEHGGYVADLPVWHELAEVEGGPVLDLGAGTGRVAADLAAKGHEVVALDSDPALLDFLAERAPTVTTVTADARNFEIEANFPLVIAPMQLVQIVGGRKGRAAMLDRVRTHLREGGLFAAALARPLDAIPEGPGDDAAAPGVDDPAAPGGGDLLGEDPSPPPGGGDLGEDPSPPLPDMLERDGWVFSSQPVAVEERDGSVVVTRRRQAVSPGGELSQEEVEIALDVVSIDDFEQELRDAGFRELARREVAETEDHIGSVVITCRSRAR